MEALFSDSSSSLGSIKRMMNFLAHVLQYFREHSIVHAQRPDVNYVRMRQLYMGCSAEMVLGECKFEAQ